MEESESAPCQMPWLTFTRQINVNELLAICCIIIYAQTTEWVVGFVIMALLWLHTRNGMSPRAGLINKSNSSDDRYFFESLGRLRADKFLMCPTRNDQRTRKEWVMLLLDPTEHTPAAAWKSTCMNAGYHQLLDIWDKHLKKWSSLNCSANSHNCIFDDPRMMELLRYWEFK